jgi:hypothetical protein
MNWLEASTAVANSTMILIDWPAILEQSVAVGLGILAALGLWNVIHLNVDSQEEVQFQLELSRWIARNAPQIADQWLEETAERIDVSMRMNTQGEG